MTNCLLSVVLFGYSGILLAAQPKIKPASAIDGVYVTYGMHNTVIELKEGTFRYWFNSDANRGNLEGIEGPYIKEGDKLILKHSKLIPLVSNWTVRSVDGVVTLWRSDAMKLSNDGKLDLYLLGKENFFKTGGGSILVPTKKTAEEAWKTPQFAVLTETEHKAFVEKQHIKTIESGGVQPSNEAKSKSDDSVNSDKKSP